MLSFHVKFVQTDRRTDRRTMVKQYAPNLLIRGHENEKMLITNILSEYFKFFFPKSHYITDCVVRGYSAK